jgi:ribonucleoside-diphosphate reductase beta chain
MNIKYVEEYMGHILNELHRPVNWNERNDAVTQDNWDINTKHFWLDKDVPFDKDPQVWRSDMSEAEKIALTKALAGLTVLDTRQGTRGMPLIGLHEEDEQVAAVLSWMGTMEHIHAKSYSKIFQSLLSNEDIKYYMKEWAVKQPNLQYKADRVVSVYNNLWKREVTLQEKWRAKAVSVALESGLFYSGFYFPTLLAGGWGGKDENARMTNTNDIIYMIIRDESVHGQFVGWLGWNDFTQFTPEEQAENEKWFREFMEDLYKNEVEYTKELYTEVGMFEDAMVFVRYNFNNVFLNLNLDPMFEEEEVNPLILAGIDTGTKTHDYFSRTGSYFKANVTPITNATFDMSRP